MPVVCGWLRRAFSRPARLRRARSPVRTSPLASDLPLTCQALPFAGGPSGPYLSTCGGQLLTVRCAYYAGGASLTTFGFVTIVPRYLLPQVMPSHSFAALTALVVRRVNGGVALFMHCVNGLADQPMSASTSRRATPKGVERALGGGTLPPALVVRRVNRHGDQPMPASSSRRATPKGHWRAHPAAAPGRPRLLCAA